MRFLTMSRVGDLVSCGQCDPATGFLLVFTVNRQHPNLVDGCWAEVVEGGGQSRPIESQGPCLLVAVLAQTDHVALDGTGTV